jgi:uncharacterized OB-fold protein
MDDASDARTWEPRPLPEVTPETAPFWEGAADGEFRLGYCPDCELSFFYPRARCPDCLSEADLVEAEGEGSVYTYTVPEKVSGWPEESLPLVVAYVELAEGPRVVTNIIDCSPEEVTVGAEVAVDFIESEEEDVAVPVFRLVGDG